MNSYDSKRSDKGLFSALSVQDKSINGFESTLSCQAGLVMCFDKVVHERVVAGNAAHFPLPALANSFMEGLYPTSLSKVTRRRRAGGASVLGLISYLKSAKKG